MGRLFWKTWASLWLVLLTTLALAGYIVEQLATVDAHEAARHRPWQTIESLAMEAERVAERGGDLGAWSRSDTATRLGTVYLLDANGDALGGGMLPEALGQASLRPFARAAGDDAGEGGFSTESTRALARTVFAPGQAEPYTLVFIPDAGERWSDYLPTPLVLVLVGLVLTALGAWLFSRHLLAPMQALFHASERVAKGDFSARPGQLFAHRSDELAQLARRFDEMSERLARSTEFQKTLLRDVSHELRSPLARLQVASEIVEARCPPDAIELAQRMQKEIAHVETMIGEILTLARFDHETEALTATDADLIPVVREIVDDMALQATPSRHVLHLDADAGEAFCRFDRKLLRRCLQSILANAIKYAPAGSPVRVAVTAGRASWRIVVEDDGPGVPESELQRIFRPFYRGSADAGRRSEGFGVGLAMAARIAHAHGGEISAGRASSGGLEVTIDLPREAA